MHLSSGNPNFLPIVVPVFDQIYDRFMKRYGGLDLEVAANCEGKSVSFSSKLKCIHPLQSQVIKSLAKLDVIQFVKVTEQFIRGSNEVAGHHQVPITKPEHPTATGIWIEFDYRFQLVEFVEINSPKPGNGSKMVGAVLSVLPKDWQATVGFDHSDGFWDVMKRKFNTVEWMEI